MTNDLDIYDTTLHHSESWPGLPLPLPYRIRLARRLDKLGVTYIEIGLAGDRHNQAEFYEAVQKIQFRSAKLALVGGFSQTGVAPSEDPGLRDMLEVGVPVCSMKASAARTGVHAKSPPGYKDLDALGDQVAYLKAQDREVIFAADHFFDGYKEDTDFAVACLQAAQDGGADVLTLCDHSGQALPWEVAKIVHEVAVQFPGERIGILAGNQGHSAAANVVAAAGQGAEHIQGSINGYGTRSGNANLCNIIPDLELRMGMDCLSSGDITDLLALSADLAEVVDQVLEDYMPYVGKSEFAPV